MNDTATMAAFGASDRACYEYPEDTELAKAQRAAFCHGAGWAATENERLRAALDEALNWIDPNTDPHLENASEFVRRMREQKA